MKRLTLSALLRDIFAAAQNIAPEQARVYFQPPDGALLQYPCLIYSLDKLHTLRADNRNYTITPTYELKVLTTDPDSRLPEVLLQKIPTCKFHRSFTQDSLYHVILSLY